MSELTTQSVDDRSTPTKVLVQGATQQALIAHLKAESTANVEADLVLTALIGITAFINSEQQLMLFNF